MRDHEDRERLEVRLELVEARLARRRAAHDEARARADAETALREAAACSEESLKLARELDQILHSTTWRLARLLMALVKWLPPRFRANARRLFEWQRTPAQPDPREQNDACGISKLHSFPADLVRRRIQRLLFVSDEPDTPGHLFRCVRPAEAAREAGFFAACLPLAEVNDATLQGLDVLILWRIRWSARVAALVQAAKTAKITILFDIDDLIFDPQLARPTIIDGIRTSASRSVVPAREAFRRLQQTLLAADACTSTTETLAQQLREWQKPAYVLPVVFDEQSHRAARRAFRSRRKGECDGLVRIGYQAGTRTHQRDFGVAVRAIAQVMHERPQTVLVMTRDVGGGVISAEEFPELKHLEDRIEWRNLVPHASLPDEYARFDINIAPLELRNAFCTCKSAVKYIEAALVSVCTIASPTPPFAEAIENGRTGFLAETPECWYRLLLRLVDDRDLRQRIGRAAYHDVLWRFGPHCCREAIVSLVRQLEGPEERARAFELELFRRTRSRSAMADMDGSDLTFSSDQLQEAEVTILLTADHTSASLLESLESTYEQSVDPLDLIVMHQGDQEALALVTQWSKQNCSRFNRLLVVEQNEVLARGARKNQGFELAETTFVLPIESDVVLSPGCVSNLLAALRGTAAAYAYAVNTTLAGFLASDQQGGAYQLVRYANRDLHGPLALIAKWAWAGAGGFDTAASSYSVEFDFWCRLAALGVWGKPVSDELTEIGPSECKVPNEELDKLVLQRHPWLPRYDGAPPSGTERTARNAQRPMTTAIAAMADLPHRQIQI